MIEHLKQLSEQLHLGNIVKPPKRIYGGFLHTMYKLQTEKGNYAIKQLNPEIMKRDTAMGNYLLSEKLARLAATHNINAISANLFDGRPVIEVSGCYYLVFDWVEGQTLASDVLDLVKVHKISEVLAQIHELDSKELMKAITDPPNLVRPIDWSLYTGLKEEFSELDITWLKSIETETNLALLRLTHTHVLSHRDLDKKNVLWSNDNQAIIIDWESAGLIHPILELIEVAINWSLTSQGNLDKKSFCELVYAYLSYRKIVIQDIIVDIPVVLSAGYRGRLDWLVYNLNRSAGREVSCAEEVELGRKQVIDTLMDLKNYTRLQEKIVDWLTLGRR